MMNSEIFLWEAFLNGLDNHYELTIYPRYGRCYMKKEFSEIFKEAPRMLQLDPKNKFQIIIQEGGMRNKGFCSQKTVQEISENIGATGNMCFHFFKGEENGQWIGVYLPDLSASFLWDALREEARPYIDEQIEQMILYCFYTRFGKVVSYEEIGQLFIIALCMAARQNKEKMVEYSILYTLSLIRALKKSANKGKSTYSYDKPVKVGCACTYLDLMGKEDSNFKNIEIEEFVDSLDFMERYVLRILQGGHVLERLTGISQATIDRMSVIVYKMRCKAVNYFGLDEIQSYFQFAGDGKEKFSKQYENISVC